MLGSPAGALAPSLHPSGPLSRSPLGGGNGYTQAVFLGQSVALREQGCGLGPPGDVSNRSLGGPLLWVARRAFGVGLRLARGLSIQTPPAAGQAAGSPPG